MIRRPRPARSFVILTVLIIVGMALLIATSLLFTLQAEAAGSAGALNATQSRALARSGLHVVMRALHEQRQRMLDGAMPELDGQYEIFEDDQRIGVVRLLPVTPRGGVIAPEAGKLDLNRIDAETLAATGLVSRDLAERIVGVRDGEPTRPFQSVAELFLVKGVTVSMVYGEVDDLAYLDDAGGREAGLGERVMRRLAAPTPRGLADVVTVYGAEPALQATGVRRIRLPLQLSESLQEKIEERFGDLADDVRAILTSRRIKEESDLVRVLRERAVPSDRWNEILDVFTTDPNDLHLGRIDLNTASLEALRGLDGLSPEQAAQIVRVRETLGDDERSEITWPLVQGIIDEEVMQQIFGHITTRCFTFRVRLAAGTVNPETPDGPLLAPVIYEAVIDCCDPVPRLGYLRDVTMMQTAAMLVDQATGTSDPEDDDPEEPDPPPGEESADPAFEESEEPPVDEGETPDPPIDADASTPAPKPQRVGRWHSGASSSAS